jgi:hypothetical protein
MPHELETEEDGLSGWRKRFLKFIERKSIKYLTHTVVVSDDISKWYIKEYGVKNISVIRNIPDFNTYGFKEKKMRMLLKLLNSDLVFLYQGLIDVTRGINSLISVFSKFENTNKHLVFMGYGPYVEYVKESSKAFLNIHFIDAVPASEIMYYTSDADVGLTFIPGQFLTLSYRYSLSNKFFEYIKCNIPILVSNNLVSISNEVSNHQLGWVVNSNDDDLFKFIEDVKSDDILNFKYKVKKAEETYNWNSEVSILSKINL